jgi:RHS repeat-associated protein
MLVPTRHGSTSPDSYRFGFNGKEMDNEIKGEGVQYDYGFRIYDSRIGRFLSLDPLFSGYPYYTPYQFAGNRPIWAIDLDGLEELCKTRKKVIIVKEWGVQVNKRIWYDGGGRGYFVESGETILEQGDIGGATEVTETTYFNLPWSKDYNSSTRFYTAPTMNPSLDAVDPNDNSKEINPTPIGNDDKPIIEICNDTDIIKKRETVIVSIVDKKAKINTQKIKAAVPTITRGQVISQNLQGLIYPHVDNDGFEFKDRNLGQFPAKKILTTIVNNVNNSPGIKSITISGSVFHGSGVTTANTKASFYTGLLKLQRIFRDLGLNKNVKVNVDYEKTKAIKSEKDAGINIIMKFN